jgi:hypothetical protein
VKYAYRTRVPVAQSRTEIERVLVKYNAGQIMFGFESTRAIIGFSMERRLIRFELPLPEGDDQGCRQRWRALLLAIKAKLESVECGIETFEEAFLAHIVVPGTGRTMGQHLIPQLEDLTNKKGAPQLPGF